MVKTRLPFVQGIYKNLLESVVLLDESLAYLEVIPLHLYKHLLRLVELLIYFFRKFSGL